MNLKDILAKKASDLSAEEKAFLQEHWGELDAEQQKAFAEVAPEEVDDKAFASLITKTIQEKIEAKTDKLADEFAKTFLNEIGNQRAKAIDTGRPAQDEHREISKQWLTAVVSHDYATLKAMSTGSNADGGYTVPKVISNEIIRKANEDYGVARRLFSLRNFNGAGNTVQLFVEGDDAVAFWTNEGAKKSSSGITIDVIELALKKLAVIIPFTDELLEDSSLNLTELISSSVARAMAKKEDAAFFNGTGTPYTGLFNDADVNIVRSGSTTMTTLTTDLLQDVIDATPSEFAENGKFLLNRLFMSVDRKMKDTTGRYLFSDATAGSPATLMGYEAIISDVAPAPGAAGNDKPILAFGDYKRAAVVTTKGNLAVKLLDQATVYDTDNSTEINLAQQDMSALRFVERVGFKMIQPEAVTVLKTPAA
jgi:HK97 family phage major capsid protein